ncbi:uncharacterized protein A4U43_C06F2420 [Asparagus officinalis]|uniref:NAD-dependent epimerase/dehydratase domain-containing protein n=1 Tax=Asparagus officinalis TaxID=4686 RepID=A0A5P1EL49_ASPOF|nr:dihydroflavonol 4-reductase [Asparagus officinalis]ONK65927.1 uncharacterized protein A4U43_C06F2420 [Asparagus officinalis]
MTTVCVTGATGYIGSWLVRSLLSKEYLVNATTRDINKGLEIFGDCDGLKLFRGDLSEEGSFDEAVKGCVCVFHVAASMEFGITAAENIEEYVQSNVLEPAIRGTINVLQSCSRAKTVKRVIFTSSISTITGKDDNGNWRSVVDESSTISLDRVWKDKPNGWVYALSKLLTEEKAFEFAKENGIDLVSIIPPTVAGPFLTPTVPASLQVLLSPVTGDPKLYAILLAVHSRLGSIPLVHIEDICNAHIFLMDATKAKGRYVCVAGSCSLPQIASLIDGRGDEEIHESKASLVISSKKLTDLGFEFKFSVRDIVKDTVSCYVECGFLKS